MTAGFSVTMTGIPQAQARIAQVSAALMGACQPAAQAAATVVEEDAKRRVQAWPAVLSGDLLDSIHTEDGASGPGSASVDVIADADHGPFVEFGTEHMAAQPFMRPAADENEAPAAAAAAGIFRAAVAI